MSKKATKNYMDENAIEYSVIVKEQMIVSPTHTDIVNSTVKYINKKEAKEMVDNGFPVQSIMVSTYNKKTKK